MDDSKNSFKKISKAHKECLPFSLHYEWWNEVVVDQWEVAALEKNGETKAVWPYFSRKKGPWKMIAQPSFTPYGGPVFNYPTNQKKERKYSWEQKVIEGLIEELGEYSELLINCHTGLKNTLPFIWAGFEDKKKYTYLLDLGPTEEEIWEGFRENIRRQIRKAEKEIKVFVSSDPLKMGELLKDSYSSQKEEYPIEDERIYQRIFNYLEKYNCGEFLEARDQKGELHAMLVWIHDQHSAYYLIGGAASRFKNSGAISLLMWEAIRRSKSVRLENGGEIKKFNFEGSMIPAVEKYLRGFGGDLTPYSCLIKNQSNSLKVLRKLKR